MIILTNRNAGGGQARAFAHELVSGDTPFSNALLLDPVSIDQARYELDQALTGERQQLVVIGGDGTLNLAVNTVLNKGLGDKITFSLLPAGTGSDFARTLTHYPTVAVLQRAQLDTQSRSVDVLRIDWPDGQYRYAINTVSAGIAGDVSAAMAASSGKGSGAYLYATLRALLRYRPRGFSLTVDKKHCYHGDLSMLAITNGAYFGQGMKVAPKAKVNDGQAEVVAAFGMSKGHLLLRLIRIYLGNHLDAPYVYYQRGSEVSVHQDSPTSALDIDGESALGADITIRVIAGALRFSC